jgi:hypothetical protein
MPVINSATVETLTAEVRVLMVGSRQVTLSVFRQLDWIDYDECEPFGRVNEGEGRVVVGKHILSGVLARAKLIQEQVWANTDGYHVQGLLREKADLLKKIESYEEALKRYDEKAAQYRAIINDETKSLSDRGHAEDNLGYLKVYETDPSPKLQAVNKELVNMENWKKRSEKNIIYNRTQIARFNALPLIVLAGLR